MKISVHTVAKNAIRLDFHLEHMLRHHLPFADEIVVMEGHSTDGTYEQIRDIDPKIKIVRAQWEATDSYLDFVEKGRLACTGDWLVKLDADEFLPEWEWERLRSFLESTDDLIVPIRLRNFYGNYKVEHKVPEKLRWPHKKWCIHPNREDIKFWGDASNVSVDGQEQAYGRSEESFEVHHFGAVRHASRLREKWRTQAIRNQIHSGKYSTKNKIRHIPNWVFNLLPHKWMDPDIVNDIGMYDGPVMRVVSEDPGEFVRDKFSLVKFIEKRNQAS